VPSTENWYWVHCTRAVKKWIRCNVLCCYPIELGWPLWFVFRVTCGCLRICSAVIHMYPLSFANGNSDVMDGYWLACYDVLPQVNAVWLCCRQGIVLKVVFALRFWKLYVWQLKGHVFGCVSLLNHNVYEIWGPYFIEY
jgi:hypothetical protein